jgi:multiple sugar transport system substrate-binding protein
MYYGIKLRATKLLIENTDNTFVTPVFNGSAALRDAAGQMIEEVTKAVRRKKTVDGAFIDALYEKVTSLHRLDSIETQQTGGDLGEYPTTAKVLVFSLVGVWAVMGGYVVWNIARKRRNAKK